MLGEPKTAGESLRLVSEVAPIVNQLGGREQQEARSLKMETGADWTLRFAASRCADGRG